MGGTDLDAHISHLKHDDDKDEDAAGVGGCGGWVGGWMNDIGGEKVVLV